MAQDLLKISLEAFEIELHSISTGTLKNLLVELFTFIKKHADILPQPKIIELERKQTKIWKELQRRKVLNNNTNVDFTKWLFNKHEKKYH